MPVPESTNLFRNQLTGQPLNPGRGPGGVGPQGGMGNTPGMGGPQMQQQQGMVPQHHNQHQFGNDDQVCYAQSYTGFLLKNDIVPVFIHQQSKSKRKKYKKRSSHQGKKEVTCIVSKPLVSCLWGCGIVL